MNINAQFKESNLDHQPVHVYIQFRKRDSAQSHLIITSVAEPSNIEQNWYTASFDFATALDLMNGEYEITIVASDSRAYNSARWVIGTVKTVFLNGVDEGNNLGIHDQYLDKPEIINWFDTEYIEHKRTDSTIIPLVFIFMISGLFLRLLINNFVKLPFNVAKMDTWGFLFVLAVLFNMGVLMIFWVKVTLINTLWTFLFTSPFSYLIMSKALRGSADCEVGDFKLHGSSSNNDEKKKK